MRLASAVFVVAVLAAFPGLGLEVVVAHADTGAVVAREPLPNSGAFAVDYVHSVYRAPVRELFAAAPGLGSGAWAAHPGFRLVAIESPRAAVLDYYALEGHRQALGGWLRLTPQQPVALEALPIIGTPVGRRTLVVDGAAVPLFDPDEPARHVVLEVRRPRALAAAINWLRRQR